MVVASRPSARTVNDKGDPAADEYFRDFITLPVPKDNIDDGDVRRIGF